MKNPVLHVANNGRTLLLILAGSWLTAALLFSLTEDTGLLDSLYWSMTTMSTVGYGDLSPATVSGKVVTIAFQAWSIFFLVPCAVAHVIDTIRQDNDEFTHDEQEWQEESLMTIAAGMGIELPRPPRDTNHGEAT